MARNSSERAALSRLGTWRSGGESPSFPGSGDARRLLRAVDRTPVGTNCTLVRVRLGASDRRTLVRVRDRLLGEEPIVGTSIGRDAGSDDPGTFDILVVPDCDPVSVGRAIADVDDVVGVAATAFESPGSGGNPAPGATDPVDGAATPRSVVDESVVNEAVVDELDRGPLEGDDTGILRSGQRAGNDGTDTVGDDGTGPAVVDGTGPVSDDGADPTIDQGADSENGTASTTAGVGGLRALEETDGGPGASGRSRTADVYLPEPACTDGDDRWNSDRPPRANGGGGTSTNRDRRAKTNGGRRTSGQQDGETSAHAALPPGRRRSGGSTSGQHGRDESGRFVPVVAEEDLRDRLDRIADRLTKLEAALDDGEQRAAPGNEPESDDAHTTPDELEDRLSSLESTVAELERCQRRMRDALVGDPH